MSGPLRPIGQLIQRKLSLSKKKKYYVVWHGTEPGIYASWDECRSRVEGVTGAVYKAFNTAEEAEEAYYGHAADYMGKKESRMPSAPSPASREIGTANPPSWRTDTVLPLPPEVTADALAVDAACSGNPGQMEYRGVYLKTGQEVFHFGPVYGTNNIGEFLAIVHALALLKQKGVNLTVYSDSRNAMLWVKRKQCRTKLPRTPRTEELFCLIARAEAWLKNNTYADIPLLKWETRRWGEVPADFGRKG